MFTIEELKKTNEKAQSLFMEKLITKWEEIHNKSDVFRYKINKIREKLTGPYLLQLNPDRSTNRRIPEQIDNICQKFDDNKFNFTKVSPQEILFYIRNELDDEDTHSVIVNVSPISKYHSLLCPSVNKKLPQVVTRESLELALRVMFVAQDCNLKIGFNSLCALASLNHLHYHLFIEKNVLHVETANWKQLKGSLYCLEDYPVPAFCFKVNQTDIRDQAHEIYKLIQYLLDHSIAHNIMMCSKVLGRAEVYIWPRKSTSGVKQLTAFNVAVCELSGWFPIFCQEAFQNLTIHELEDEIKKWSIPSFEKLCNDIMELY